MCVLYRSCKICNRGERGWGERKKTSEARRQLEMNAGLSGCCSAVTCLLGGLARLWEGAGPGMAPLVLLGGTSGAGSRLQCPLSSRASEARA